MKQINYKCPWLGECVIIIPDEDKFGRVSVTVNSSVIGILRIDDLPGFVFRQNKLLWVPLVAQKGMPDRYFGEDGEGYFRRVHNEYPKDCCMLCGTKHGTGEKGEPIKTIISEPKELYIDHERMAKRDKKDRGTIYYKEAAK